MVDDKPAEPGLEVILNDVRWGRWGGAAVVDKYLTSWPLLSAVSVSVTPLG